MRRDWYSLTEVAAARLPGLPGTVRGLLKLADREGWRAPTTARKMDGRDGGGGWEYHISVLPKDAQARLLIVHSAPANDDRDQQADQSKALWAEYEALGQAQKAACEVRLKAVLATHELVEIGAPAAIAVARIARQHDVSERNLWRWLGTVKAHPRTDWLPALASKSKASATRNDCHADAWNFVLSDYLRPEKPSFTSCYRRLLKAAKKQGWTPVPSERSLRRRMEAEVSEAVQVLARQGRDKAKTLYPAQRRTREHLHAMAAVNMDGHKIDVFVRAPWSEQPVRMFLIAIQDLCSGKIVAWRLSDAETWEAVRLVIGDMVEAFGIPDAIYLDNGRAFASKWISGQSRTRFRFKVRDEDPRGLLTTLGVEQHWTTPYSGQSKPIERAFRDLADMIAKHPFCAGAYTGNKPEAKPENYASRAIDLEEFRRHVALQVDDHNSQTGRKSANCGGRSFDETFAASLADPATIVRWPTPGQKSLWLLASEVIRARKGSGEIHFQGNRYWALELNQHAGRKVTIRFDPDALHKPVRVYSLDNSLICEAECIADTGFNDVEAARRHARSRRDYQKAIAAQRAAHAQLTASELADILYRGERPAKPDQKRPAVTRMVTPIVTNRQGNLAVEAVDERQFEENFSRAMSLIEGGAQIHQFPSPSTGGGDEPESFACGSKRKGRV